jgi:hypothetical protein
MVSTVLHCVLLCAIVLCYVYPVPDCPRGNPARLYTQIDPLPLSAEVVAGKGGWWQGQTQIGGMVSVGRPNLIHHVSCMCGVVMIGNTARHQTKITKGSRPPCDKTGRDW